MKTKLQLRRFNSLLHKTGIKKPKKISNHVRCIDARFEEAQDKIIISEINKSKKDLPKYKTFEIPEEVSKSPYQIYQEFRKKALQSKENLSEIEFLETFSNRIELLDREIKKTPFHTKSIRIEDETMEFIYKHLLSQVFKSQPAEYKNNPVLLFKHIQSTISSGLESMNKDVDNLDGVFKLHKFLDFVGREVSEMLVTTKSLVGKGFVPHVSFQEVSEYKFY